MKQALREMGLKWPENKAPNPYAPKPKRIKGIYHEFKRRTKKWKRK